MHVEKLSNLKGQITLTNEILQTDGKTTSSTKMTQEFNCEACGRQSSALMNLWSQIANRPHPTDFNWHCDTCGRARHLVIE
jgi:transcription elongation factor Elf1